LLLAYHYVNMNQADRGSKERDVRMKGSNKNGGGPFKATSNGGKKYLPPTAFDKAVKSPTTKSLLKFRQRQEQHQSKNAQQYKSYQRVMKREGYYEVNHNNKPKRHHNNNNIRLDESNDDRDKGTTKMNHSDNIDTKLTISNDQTIKSNSDKKYNCDGNVSHTGGLVLGNNDHPPEPMKEIQHETMEDTNTQDGSKRERREKLSGTRGEKTKAQNWDKQKKKQK
jgi:hypothetical protein